MSRSETLIISSPVGHWGKHLRVWCRHSAHDLFRLFICSLCIQVFFKACFRPLLSLLLMALHIAVFKGHKMTQVSTIQSESSCCLRKGMARGLDIAADRAQGLLANFKLSEGDIQAGCGKPEERGTARHLCLSRVLHAGTLYIYIHTSASFEGSCNCWYNVVCSFFISFLSVSARIRSIQIDLEGPAPQIRPDSWSIW